MLPELMNVFTTDHPMVSQPSCFDARAHPWSSYFWSVVVLAGILTPFLYGFVLYSDMHDAFEIGSETAPFPTSLTEFAAGAGASFLCCLMLAVVLVSVYRLLRRIV